MTLDASLSRKAYLLMRSKLFFVVPFFSAGLLAQPLSADPLVANGDATSKLEKIGNPFLGKTLSARHVWDAQRFGNRVYFGHGDYDNNAGPIPIVFYEPAASAFQAEYVADDEEVQKFRVLGGTLTVPGFDPREDWSFGNFYRKDPSGWAKYRTVPNGIHMMDLYRFGGQLFTAASLNAATTKNLVSNDDGQTWQNVSYANMTTFGNTDTFQHFFELGGNLYASTLGFSHILIRYQGNAVFTDMGSTLGNGMFPGISTLGVWMERTVNFNNQVVYLAVMNDPQSGGHAWWSPQGVFKAATIGQGQKINLPGNPVPWDVIEEGGNIYILASTGSASSYTHYVYASSDLSAWTEVLRFNSNSNIQSFEKLGGDFYFGLGGKYGSATANTGDILRVKTNAITGIVASNNPPSSAIASPANGASFNAPASIAINANAADTDGTISKVEFYANGIPISTDTSGPFSATWSNVPAGSYILTARAFDNNGAVMESTGVAISVITDVTPPALSSIQAANVNFTSAAISWATNEPANTQVVYGTSTAYGSTTTLVAAYTSTHSQVLSNLLPGKLYNYQVRSRDPSGNLGQSANFTFTTPPDTTIPTVHFTAPVVGSDLLYGPSGGLVSGTVNILANASDNIGVARVNFYVDGILVSSDATSPYSYSWNTRMVGDGFHYLNAQSVDSSGNTSYSGILLERSYVVVSNSTAPAAAPGKDVTAQVQNLGNPFIARLPTNGYSEYARNVWDMQVWNNRIYLGHGNSANIGPATNAGPIPLWFYDPSSGTFATDSISGASCGNNCIDEEQLDTFRIISGTMYIASHDPRGAGGQFYRIEGNAWKEHSGLQNYPGTHNYDMALDGGLLFASGGPISFSLDNGATWQYCGAYPGGRSFRMFKLAGKLYVDGFGSVHTGNGFFQSISSATTVPMLPPVAADDYVNSERRIAKETTLGATLVYIAAQAINDHQWLPVSLMKATDIGVSQQIFLPANPIPRDIVVVGSTVYVLGHTGLQGNFTNFVYSSTDLVNWTETLRFAHAAFARSFEYLNGYFYFGMGTETSPLSATTGNILRVADPTPPPPDITAPVISSVQISGLYVSSAAISWTTDENSDSQVEYGLTTAYGSATPLPTPMALSHSSVLSGLAANTTYHFRVKSRDAAGNLSVSGDFTFTTVALLGPPSAPLGFRFK